MAFWGHWPWARSPDEGMPDADILPDDEPSAPSAPQTTEATPAREPTALEMAPNEALLIAAAQAGDEAAFAQIVQTHYHSVFRLAFRVVHDREDALEIAQEVFVAAWQGLGNFHGNSRLSTWLHTITYRRALRISEARKQHGNALSRFAEEQLGRITGAWNTEQAHSAEQHWQHTIAQQVEQLPPRYREVLKLRHMQDLSYEEISQRLTIPVSSVKTQLFRARQMLRERLEALDMASLQQGVRDHLPQITLPALPHMPIPDLPEMPHVERPRMEIPRVKLPHVEMPQVPALDLQGAAQALRERLEAGATGLGEVLRGHISRSEPKRSEPKE